MVSRTPTPDDLDPSADVRQLSRSDAGRAALEHVRGICEGPALDDRNQYAVVALLTAYWAGRAGSVLAALRSET